MMMETKIFNIKGEETGEVNLPENYFGVKVSKGLLHEVVTYYLANKRVGTAHTKTRAEVSGGGAKPWKQKHTGRARVGSIRSPLWRKGGITFGPRTRDFSYSLPAKKLKAALAHALSAKFSEGGIKVVEGLDIFSKNESPVKTKTVQNILNKLKIADKTIIVKTQKDEKFARASSNIPKLMLRTFKDLNAYDVLAAQNILFEKDSLPKA